MLQYILEEMLSVEEQGGVTVRRDGNGKLEHWQYGYRYIYSPAPCSTAFGTLSHWQYGRRYTLVLAEPGYRGQGYAVGGGACFGTGYVVSCFLNSTTDSVV